jgi:hypothetical protein
MTPKRRLWFLTILGLGLPSYTFTFPDGFLLWDVVVDVVLAAVGLVAAAGLLGFGPLRLEPDVVPAPENGLDGPSDVDLLVELARRQLAGELSDDEFEVEKRRIIGA